MKRDDLSLILIILCTAALAAVTFALSGSFDREGTVKAYFVSEKEFEAALGGKKTEAFDPSVLQFEGCAVPYDSSLDTFYIPQSCGTGEWEGKLTVTQSGGRILITCDDLSDPADKAAYMETGSRCRLAVVFPDSCMESGVVFTGLPAVCLSYEDGDIRGKEEHAGLITVLDPYRDEYQSFECAFHVRGNTSVLFGKKSYRAELRDRTGNERKESILGLRRDDDWVLNSLSTDKTLAREKVCYDLWAALNKMEQQPVAAPVIEYAELFMNGSYMGVYGVMYPVDRKLMGMNPGDLLYKIRTWKEELDAPGRLVDYNGQQEVLNTNGFAYASIEYPKADEGFCDWGPLQAYQDFVFESQDLLSLKEQGISLNMDNFILHELFCEMARAADNTWKNLFLAAYADGRGGYTLCETIWDLNYTFGDSFVWDPENGNTAFLKESTDTYKLRYDRDYVYSALVLSDEETRRMADEKWERWRADGVCPDMIKDMFRAQRSLLIQSGAMQRNEEKWPGSTTEDNGAVYEWIDGRFRFLDGLHSQK